MLDLNRLERIRLSANPIGQKTLASLMLMPNYDLPPRVKIRLEGGENLPDQPVIFALNHTDRYNYWPFQYRLWREFGRYTATWVKGKYYENKIMGRFMEAMNNIPTVSRGYLIARDFKEVCEREPSLEEYQALRAEVDEAAGVKPKDADRSPINELVPAEILERPRNILGRPFNPPAEDYPHYINGLFGQMMRLFVGLNVEAYRKELNLLVFPQGTRSIRLSRGHIGLAQMALFLKAPVVPVGCNGSDKVYPGNSPIAQAGEIVYRIGEPIYYKEHPEFHVPLPYEPFSAKVEIAHHDTFQGYVDMVMERINELLDPEYQFADDLHSDGVQGSQRFL